MLLGWIRDALDVTPRDVDQRDQKLVPGGARMAISSGLRLHKYAYY